MSEQLEMLAGGIIGTIVRLARPIDLERPCCANLAIVHPGKGPHAGELRCEGCGRHRGWLLQAALDFITTTLGRFGAPAEPIVLRQSQEERTTMTDFDNTNRGALFRNSDKTEEKHPDYRGTINVDGTEYWVSSWIKTSKKGTKYMSLAVKPKEEAVDKSKPRAEELNDGIPF
jgi:hypothetical protein